MEKNSVDNVLCKGRESREKIIRSYRRLVVSIATSYQDKGLSLQDLIQVRNTSRSTLISFQWCANKQDFYVAGREHWPSSRGREI
jgi:hypothetical protein